jgi:serine/threonine protein kinase
MLAGFAPYEGADQMTTIRNILTGALAIPPALAAADPDAADIITQLLARNVVDRLGCRREGAAEIFRHPWFAGIDFAALLRKELPAPWTPERAADDDVRYFEAYDESDGEGETEGPALRRAAPPADGGGGGDDDGDGDDGGDAFALSVDLPARLLSPLSSPAAMAPAAAGAGAAAAAAAADELWFEGF